jgi:hypothetical protein
MVMKACLRQAKFKTWITGPEGVGSREAGLIMSSLRKRRLVDFRQGSPNRRELSDLHGCLLHADLPMLRIKPARGGIIDSKKQNHSWAAEVAEFL